MQGRAGEHDRIHEGRELANRGQHEEAAEAVKRAEQDQEVGGLESGRAVAKATVETNSGNQYSFRANMNWLANSPP